MIDDRLLKRNSPTVPLGTALLWIIVSIIIINGAAGLALFYFQHLRDKRIHDDKFRIVAIVQTGRQKESLKPVYFAELLGLSIDKPTNLFQFNSYEAKQKLLSSPLIKEASIKKISPGTIFIDYNMRKPIAFLADYDNTVLDDEGHLFPFKPFFTPKKLPEIFLGNNENESFPELEEEIIKRWGSVLKGEKIQLALNLLNIITIHCCTENSHLKRIDVSKADALSYGQRQIIIFIEDQLEKQVDGRSILYYFPRILRLSPERYHQELGTYLELRKYLSEKEWLKENIGKNSIVRVTPKIIELRIPHLAVMTP
jgi:POTRA domain, FtsQ-type